MTDFESAPLPSYPSACIHRSKEEDIVSRERKSVQGIRTMGALVDTRRTRTSAGALLELSALSNEKVLLTRELDRWKTRHVDIEKRLGEIAAKERRLMTFVQASEASHGASTPVSALEPTVEGRVKFKELSY
jgi:hypothetical protein